MVIRLGYDICRDIYKVREANLKHNHQCNAAELACIAPMRKLSSQQENLLVPIIKEDDSATKVTRIARTKFGKPVHAKDMHNLIAKHRQQQGPSLADLEKSINEIKSQDKKCIH